MRKIHKLVPLATLTFVACSTHSHGRVIEAPTNGTGSLPRIAPSSQPFTSPAYASLDSAHIAQEPAADTPSADNPWEVTVGGAGASNDDFDAGGAQLGATVGYYLNRVAEISFRQNVWFTDEGRNTSEKWNGASRFAIDLHLPTGRVQPYVGANAGYVYGDTVKETFVAGPEAGVKIYLQDDAFLQAGAEYQFFFDKDDSLDAAFDDGQILYALTLGIRF